MNAAEFAVYSRREWRAPAFRFPAAHYEARPDDATIDGSNRAVLQYDKSGNSATNVLCLNGVAGNYAQTADSAALDITGDIEIMWDAAVANYSLGGGSAFIAKYVFSTDNRSWIVRNNPTRVISFVWSTDGTAATVVSVDFADHGVADLQRQAFKVTLDVDNGAGGWTAKLFKAPTADGPFVQVGSDVTGVGVTSIFASTAPLEVASQNNGTSTATQSVYYRAWVKNGIGGTTVWDANFSLPAKLATSFTESSVNAATVMINAVGNTGARIAGARDIAQFTASKMAVYTAPTANSPGYFTKDGSNDYSRSPAFSLAQPLLRVSAIRQVTWTSGDYIFDGVGGANTGALVQTTSTPQLNLNAGSSVAGNTSLPVDTDGVIVEVLNGASSSLRVSRGAATTGDAGAGSPNGVTLGANGASTAASFGNARYMEEVIYQGTQYDAIAQDRIARQFMRKKRMAMAA